MDVDLTAIDHALHDVLEHLVRDQGPVSLTWLVGRARRELRDARVTEESVAASIATSTMLVWKPDGAVDHLIRVLDDIVLTLRVRAPLRDRTDLWGTVSLQPLLNIAGFADIPLADGSGFVSRPAVGHEVLNGPPGWLPDIERYEVIGIRLRHGMLSTFAVEETDYPSPEIQERVRKLLVGHYRLERWYSGDDDLASRPGEMVRALAHAKLEDPDLLARPHPPLEELLYLPLERDQDAHYWRERGAQVEGTSSFVVTGMPDALDRELRSRAGLYGMSFDQYVIAVLGHGAWRTPFADDLGPWESWMPDESSEDAAHATSS